MLEGPARDPALRRRVVGALQAGGARRLSPGVFLWPASPDSLDRLRPLFEEVRRSGGRVMVADVRTRGGS